MSRYEIRRRTHRYSAVVSDVGGESGSVHLHYELRPDERMLFVLRFGRMYRVLGPIGAALIGVVALQLAPDWIWLLLPLGIALAVSFLWLPFATRFGSTPITFDAAADGLTIASGGASSSLSWGTIRSIRRVGGALAIEVEPAGTFAVPVRVFRHQEQRTFEALAAANLGAESAPSQLDVEPILIRGRSDIRFLDTVLVLALRPMMLAPLVLGGILIAAGVSELLAPASDPFKSITLPLIVIGVVFVTLPLWGAAWRVYLGGGTGAMGAPYEIEIGALGYRARLRNADSWHPWDSFESMRRVGSVYAFRVRGSKAEVVLSARGFSPADQNTLQEVLRASGIKGA
jgi:hypothetical protein